MAKQATATTIVFADVCRSTQLFETLGDVKARELVSRALSILERLTSFHLGKVIQTIGDEVMCTVVQSHEAVRLACEMHRAVNHDPMLAEHDISLRIGLHSGDVIAENGNVYGDAVNTAARMAGLAKADQIITTGATVQQLPSHLRGKARRLGLSNVRGKQHAIEVFEILWEDDIADVTSIAPALGEEQLSAVQRLVISFRETTTTLSPSSPTFTLGRRAKNDLIVDSALVSRQHASIGFHNGWYILTDRSTNGTYVKQGDQAEVYVHRREARLEGSGVISLGTSIESRKQEPVYYRLRDRSA